MPSTALASPIITVLETTYAGLRRRHPDLPERIVFLLGKGARRGGVNFGHYHADQWAYHPHAEAQATDTVPEIMISGECLAAGPEQVYLTLVHEAAHALAKARGWKDTSRQGRYHNKTFVAAAEELGLTYPHERPDPKIGWSAVVLTEEHKASAAHIISRIGATIEVAVGYGMALSDDEPPRPPRVVVEVVMDTGETFELSPGIYAKVEEHLLPHEAHEEER